MVRRWLRRHDLQTRQMRNRAIAHAALAAGERRTELICGQHGQVEHVLEGRGVYRCVRCRAERVAEHRRRVKRLLVEQAGGSCVLCGYERCAAALQFHHLDPARKQFALSLQGAARSIAELQAEASKCILLCANCHAEVEVGFTDIPPADAVLSS